MGITQNTFLREFEDEFHKHFGLETKWSGGQSSKNTAALTTHIAGRRAVGIRKTECFELGDLTTTFRKWKIIIEFESKQISISNILKYWPYLRGDLSSTTEYPILLCHFSDWWSYASYRDLWEWTLSQMQVDPERKNDIFGHQFDHGGYSQVQRANSIQAAILWIEESVNRAPHN